MIIGTKQNRTPPRFTILGLFFATLIPGPITLAGGLKMQARRAERVGTKRNGENRERKKQKENKGKKGKIQRKTNKSRRATEKKKLKK